MSLAKLKEQFPHETLPTHYEVWHWQGPVGHQERHVLGTADNLKEVYRLSLEPYRQSGYLGPVYGSAVYPDGSRASIDPRFGPSSIARTPEFRYRGSLVSPLTSAYYVAPPTLPGYPDGMYHIPGQTDHDAGKGLTSEHGSLIFTLAHARELLGGVSGMQPFVDAALTHHDLTPLHLAADHLQENASEGDGRAVVEKKLRMLLGHAPEKFARAFAAAVTTITK